jgi:uncharacterized membrane protein YfcA
VGESDPTIVLALALVALVAGMIDAVAGGGGLVTVPALLLAGFDPVGAVATNKLQGVFSAASSTVAFARAGLVEWRATLPIAAVALLGSLGGAIAVGFVPIGILFVLMPVLLVAVAVYFALSRGLSDADSARVIGTAAFAASVGLIVGFYDGAFGPGAGSFYMAGFVTLLGHGVLRATAQTKLVNFASNLGALAMFMVLGAVAYPVGLAMAVGALIGAQLGSRLALRRGAKLIRPLLVVVSAAAAVRLLADPANPLRGALAWLGL